MIFLFFWFLSSPSRTRARAVWSLGDNGATNHHHYHRQCHQLQTVSSRSFNQSNSVIYGLKRSVVLRWLFDAVLHSSFNRWSCYFKNTSPIREPESPTASYNNGRMGQKAFVWWYKATSTFALLSIWQEFCKPRSVHCLWISGEMITMIQIQDKIILKHWLYHVVLKCVVWVTD